MAFGQFFSASGRCFVVRYLGLTSASVFPDTVDGLDFLFFELLRISCYSSVFPDTVDGLEQRR
jgi:hypothetical protein